MTISSQQPDYSTILTDNFTLDNAVDTITVTAPDPGYYSAGSSVNTNIGTITLNGIGGDTISFPSNFDGITIGNYFPEEFVNAFPDWDKVEEMRKEYPALDIALKKFQEIYTMVEDDWRAQQGQKYGNQHS